MQVNIGDKIRELRKRDGRKQEDVANALGVTAQAVSRWESNGCYPDMGMLPAIANYFHVSIDSLFGYNNDRDLKIKRYVEEANDFFLYHDTYQEDKTRIIQMLRNALEEFPGEPELMRFLAMALASQGYNEAEKPNRFQEEAAGIYEELLKENSSVILPLLDLYSLMGEYEKAEHKAKEQPSIRICREIMLTYAFADKKCGLANDKEKKYLGESILALLQELGCITQKAIVRNDKLYCSEEGISILLAVRKLYEVVFDEKCYGKFHSDLCMLDLAIAEIAARLHDRDRLLEYFDSAYAHYLEYVRIMSDRKNKDREKDCYESTLLKEVGNTDIFVVVCRPEYFLYVIDGLSESDKAGIMNNPKYESLFAK